MTHRAVPLREFLDRKPINISNLSNVITGSLVELQFELRHFRIKQSKVDSFNAPMQQIQILNQVKLGPSLLLKENNR
jgi:hypothetical protein